MNAEQFHPTLKRIASRRVLQAVSLVCRAGRQLSDAKIAPDKFNQERLRFLATGLRDIARLSELRRQGFRIINRTRTIDGAKHSWFRMLTSPEVSVGSAIKRTTAAEVISSQPKLFSGDRLAKLIDPEEGDGL